jgi:tellurite resistance protein
MTTPSPRPRLSFLYPGWFSIVMGLAGLALAWHAAAGELGELAGALALVLGASAAAVFAALAVATVLRGWRHAPAWAEDRRHPVRHTFVATLPISAILLATVATALSGPSAAARALWVLGALAQLGVTLWVLSRWWRAPGQGGLTWAAVTPALFIPIVGNVLVPLAGVPLGLPHWSAAQFGVGLLFWPVVLVLLVVRLAVQGPWPERLLPTGFIFVAPPAVVGLSALQFGAPPLLVWALWGMAMFTLAWAALLLPRIAALPFGLPHWGMSFPLAAAAALTMRLAGGDGGGAGAGGAIGVAALALLALASLVVLALAAGTVRGLRDGTLLAPEPVATLQPVAAEGAAAPAAPLRGPGPAH